MIMRRLLSSALVALVAILAAPASASAADLPPPPPAEPASSQSNLLWAAFQLIPSSEVVIWNGKVRYGARWQVTPLLYSFGGNRKLSRVRSFMVEPIVRHAGSIELYFAPEVLTGSFADNADRWILRGGLRSYFPLLHRGEYLSASVGGSVFSALGKAGAGFDAGLHTYGGIIGVRVGYSPTPGLRMTTLAAELRIF
ncbi:Hypothetical protein A7982_11879 [Minicystis rosea]|nr:Hypothetical protein A7982_11879 [Minicystis rosea]